MGEHEFEIGSGQLYFIEPDGSLSPLSRVDDISVPVGSLVDLEASFEWLVKISKDTMLAITGMYSVVLNCCPNKRVVHLALHGKKAKTRKKNRNRAFRILEENRYL